MASGKGGRVLPLLVLLGLLVGAGGWNYRRNVALESQEDRPFRSYAEADLAQLLAAYEGEAARAARRAGGTSRATVDERGSRLLGDSVREFERVQGASRKLRDAQGDLAESELMVAQISQELKRRDQERDPTALFLRRLTTVDF
jgi:hypothetical protein